MNDNSRSENEHSCNKLTIYPHHKYQFFMINKDNYAIKCVIHHCIGSLLFFSIWFNTVNAECVSLYTGIFSLPVIAIVIVVGASIALLIPALIIWLIRKKRTGEFGEFLIF